MSAIGTGMAIEDATGDARVVPDAMALDADFLDRRGVDPSAVGVSVQQIIVWALEHRPDLVRKAVGGEENCERCLGYGVICKKGTGS